MRGYTKVTKLNMASIRAPSPYIYINIRTCTVRVQAKPPAPPPLKKKYILQLQLYIGCRIAHVNIYMSYDHLMIVFAYIPAEKTIGVTRYDWYYLGCASRAPVTIDHFCNVTEAR